MPTLTDLLTRGYFPKELPPPFKTVSFGNIASAEPQTFLKVSETLPPAKLAHHNLARPGNFHRRLGIPNPGPHLRLCDFVVQNWPAFATQFSKSELSLSTPVDSPAGRCLNTKVPLGDLPQNRAAVRAGHRAMLSADVARFYP